MNLIKPLSETYRHEWYKACDLSNRAVIGGVLLGVAGLVVVVLAMGSPLMLVGVGTSLAAVAVVYMGYRYQEKAYAKYKQQHAVEDQEYHDRLRAQNDEVMRMIAADIERLRRPANANGPHVIVHGELPKYDL